MTDDSLVSQLPLGETVELDSGLTVQRRCFMALAASVLMAAPVAAASRIRPTRGTGPLSLEQFLVEVIPVAQELVADKTPFGEDVYLHTVASHAVQLGAVPEPQLREFGPPTGPKRFIGVNPGGQGFTVLHWKLEPGAVIRAHAHTYGNVITLGLEGSVRIRNFELTGDPDFSHEGPTEVRLTKDQLLRPRETNLVPLHRGYMHEFTAGPHGARGLDITTRLREKAKTPYYEIDADPIHPGGRIYAARAYFD